MSDITRDWSFGGTLRNIRVKHELTLRAAAQKIGMDVGNLCKLEQSELSPPRSAKRVEEIVLGIGGLSSEVEFMKHLAYQHHVGALREEFG